MTNQAALAPYENTSNRMKQASGEEIRPGSWWRVILPVPASEDAPQDIREATAAATKEASDLLEVKWAEGHTMPEHGLVLLARDVAVIDGDIHSITMHSHPAWNGSYTIKLLVEHFELCMSHEPDGAALRAAEEQSFMGHVETLTSGMSQPPSEKMVLDLVDANTLEKQRKEEARKRDGKFFTREELIGDQQALVPQALLPGRDIQRAEEELKRHMAIAEARSELMRSAVSRVNNGMAVVTRFQEEKIATALAGVSRQQAKANDLLSNVHTMKLWLGEGVELHKLVDGSPAAADAKIHFMQQLLYLDEEIFVQDMLGTGFTADDMGSLPDLLSRNPDMVRRILPYEKCVTVTRVRRHERRFGMPDNMAEVFQIFENSEADKMIQIFIRDGERVTMITADKETSGAAQLFPSKAEIDAIYRPRFGEPGEQIDVRDIRYPEKRAEHEKRALFYKRFLLILWGAHEREGAFGLLPTDMNWLTEEVQRDWFAFVHDAEAGLPDGSVPVRDWIISHNRAMRPDSRIVATWENLFLESTAPGGWSDRTHHQNEQIRVPADPVSLAVVKRYKDQAVVSCPTVEAYSSDATEKNVRVRLQNRIGDPAETLRDGVICIDHMTSGEVAQYVESRAHRKSYNEWLGQLKMVLPLILERERFEEALWRRLEAKNDKLQASQLDLIPVAHAAILAAGWKLPPASKDAGLIRQALAMDVARKVPAGPGEQVRVRPGGQIYKVGPREYQFSPDLCEPFWTCERVTSKNGELSYKEDGVAIADRQPEPGEVVVTDKTSQEEIEKIWEGSQGGLVSIADLKLAEELALGDDTSEEARGLISQCSPLLPETVEVWLDDLMAHNRASKYVAIPKLRRTLGLITVPAVLLDPNSSSDRDEIHEYGLSVDPLYMAWVAGYRKEAETFVRGLYAKKEEVVQRLNNRQSSGEPPVNLWIRTRLTNGSFTQRHNYGQKGSPSTMSPSFSNVEKFEEETQKSFRFAPRDDLENGFLAAILEDRMSQYFTKPSVEDLDKIVGMHDRVQTHGNMFVDGLAVQLWKTWAVRTDPTKYL